MSETPTPDTPEAPEEAEQVPSSEPVLPKPSRGMRFNFAFGSSVDLIKLGLLAIILAWGMRGIIGSFAQKGEANRESYRVFHKELAVDQREAAEEDQLAKAEKQTAQLKIVNDLRSQAEKVKESNRTIGEALEDWNDTIKDAGKAARDEFEGCIEDAEEEDDRSVQREAEEECRTDLARWCTEIDKDIIDAAETIIDTQTDSLRELLDDDTVERHWVVKAEDDNREYDPDDYRDDDWQKKCGDWGSVDYVRVESPTRTVSADEIFGRAGWDDSNRTVNLPNCSGDACIVLQTDAGQDVAEQFEDLQWDITMLEGKILQTTGAVELEKHTVRHEAEQDELEGQAAIAYWNQWNKWLTPISMLLYIGGVILLVLGNIGVLASGAASSGLRSFAIATSAVLVYLLLQDAIGLHVPDQGGGSSLSAIQASGTR